MGEFGCVKEGDKEGKKEREKNKSEIARLFGKNKKKRNLGASPSLSSSDTGVLVVGSSLSLL